MTSTQHQDLIDLSQQKWDWMSAQDDEPLDDLFHEDAVFVHMGATFTKDEELNVIKTGYIHYRDFDIQDVSVRVIDSTAIVLTTMQLGSVVDGNEVSNPFVTTEVYIHQTDAWKLASMSFTRLVTH